jgi:hypothetical protein
VPLTELRGIETRIRRRARNVASAVGNAHFDSRSRVCAGLIEVRTLSEREST